MNHRVVNLFAQPKKFPVPDYNNPIVPENNHLGTFDQIKTSYGKQQRNANDWWMSIRRWQEKVALATMGKQESI